MYNYVPYMFLSFLPFIVVIIIIVSIVAFFINRNHNINNMDPNQMKPKATTGDFLLNLGAIIALYTIVSYLLNLIFTVIETAYPQITSGYNYDYYSNSQSISWPVSILIILFPIFAVIMWFLEKSYTQDPEKRNMGVHKWLTYITLFVGGIILTADLITVIYYFIDGQDLTTGFLLKVFSVLIIILIVFLYYIADIRNTLTSSKRKIWLGVSTLVVIASIAWGFSVLGSPRTQRLYKYDEQKVNDLNNINSQIQNYFYDKKVLPNLFADMSNSNYGYNSMPTDQQTNKPYEYIKTNDTSYQLCAEFNTDNSKLDRSKAGMMYGISSSNGWIHPTGHYCFNRTVTSPIISPEYPYSKPMPIY